MKKRLWFRAKYYGWGWYPATWEGWVVLGIYLFLLSIFTWNLQDYISEDTVVLGMYIFEMTFLTTALLIICYLTGEKPGWRWGKKK